MACEEKGVQIIKLDPKMGDDKSRDWIAVTTPGSDSLEDEKRLTVRMPYPVGDRDVGCPYCNEGKIIDPNDETRVIDCPHCHGTESGVVTVSDKGVISVEYDGNTLENTESGLTVKVDNKTIRASSDGLTVIPAPNGYCSGLVACDNGIIVPAAYNIRGQNISIESDGRIHANAETIKGFVAKLTIDIDNTTNYLSGTELLRYHIEVEGSENESKDKWDVIYDTTKQYEHFVFSTIVEENKDAGVWFKVTTYETPSCSYNVRFTIDVHSF